MEHLNDSLYIMHFFQFFYVPNSWTENFLLSFSISRGIKHSKDHELFFIITSMIYRVSRIKIVQDDDTFNKLYVLIRPRTSNPITSIRSFSTIFMKCWFYFIYTIEFFFKRLDIVEANCFTWLIWPKKAILQRKIDESYPISDLAWTCINGAATPQNIS